MRLSELKSVLDSVGCPVFCGYGDEETEYKPPYIVYTEKTATDFFGECIIVEVVFRTRVANDPMFAALKERLAESGLVFSFDLSFDEDTKVIGRKADIYLPNAEIGLIDAEYAVNKIGFHVPKAIGLKTVPCVIVETAREAKARHGQPGRLLVTVRVQEGLYGGERYARMFGRTFVLEAIKNSLNGSVRQTDIGYLDLTFKEGFYDFGGV